MKTAQRVVLLGLILSVVGGIDLAYGLTWCTYNVSCVFDPGGDHGNGQYNCTINYVHCVPFIDPACDTACGSETQECQQECLDETGGEGSSSCATGCTRVAVACFRACIPML